MERLKEINELRDALNELRSLGVSAKKILIKIGDTIDGEKFATVEELKTFLDNDLLAWVKKSLDFAKLYLKVFHEPLPEKFSDAERKLNAAEKKIRAENLFAQAEKFLLLTAAAPDLKKILDEHCNKLKKLLAKKKQNEKTETALEPYAKFFNATNETDPVKKFSAARELSEFFGDEFIGRGLFGSELTLASADEADEKKSSEPEAEIPDEPTDETEDFVKILNDHNALLTDDDFAKWETKFYVEKIERKKEFSVVQFKRDFKDFRNFDKIKSILCYVSDIGVLSWPVFCPNRMLEGFVGGLAQLLFNKGYIQKYSFGDEYKSFYGITRDFFAFIKTDAGRKFIEAQRNNKDLENICFLAENFRYALVRMIYFFLYEIERDHGNVFDDASFSFSPTAFKAEFVGKGTRDLLLGCFWYKSEDAQSFLSRRKIFFKQGKSFSRLFIVGLTLEHARNMFDALKEIFAEDFPAADEFYFYDFGANEFYVRETLEEISPSVIWYDDGISKLNTDDIEKLRHFHEETEKLLHEDTEKNSEPKKNSEPEKISEPEEKILESEKISEPEEKILESEKKILESEKISEPEEKILEPEKISEPEEKILEPEKISEPEENLPIQKLPAPPLDATVKEKILYDVTEMIRGKKFYCATAYLKARSLEVKEAETLYRQLAFALDDPLLNEGYNAYTVSILATEDDNEFNEALITAAAVRALCYNDFGVDYGIQALHALTKSFGPVKSNAALAALLDDLKNFKSKIMKGVDFYADYRTQDKLAAEKNLAKVIRAAEDYRTHLEHSRENALNRAFIELKKVLFGRDGDLAQIFNAICDKNEVNSIDTLEFVKDFLMKIFIRDNAEFTIVNIDSVKLQQFIDDNWYAVCNRRSSGKLTGELNNSITNTLKRGAEIMCEWVGCAEILCASGEDSGSLEYKKIRSRLMDNIQRARKNLSGNAGALVLGKTLEEISRRLDGSYSKTEKKFFYAEFLLGEKIVLDENYLPNFTLNISDGSRENISEQIKRHAELKLPTFEKRIEKIFESGGDDFGSARLLDDYLKETSGESFIEKKEYDLEKCITNAGKDAQREQNNFIGGLELAQCYGQFDTLPEGEKEKILQLAENCYAYAEKSNNFGVFFRVKKYWEKVIEDNAAERGKILKEKLRAAVANCKEVAPDLNAQEIDECVEEIEKLIESRNCTAAQGLIFKLSNGVLFKRTDDDADTELVRFLDPDEYDHCYNRVKDSGYSLEILIGKKIYPHEKVSRAKLYLVQSWITNSVSEARITNLLELLGFSVESAQKISLPNTNTIVFNVKIFGDGQTKHGHPIAAFGSDAEVNGFNVMCLFGKFDEKNLLEKFKEPGNARHTLVLLDYALDLPTRRRLAKEIKLDKNLTKVFAVVDRVAIMYLLKNCATQLGTKRITATLMSLIMPFARYQPYIWSPRIPLPPEMFIGRENEINEVMNPHGGANIVCGGRQLGKSALLKMACRKVDGNNGERAIFIDIDKKNYHEAALITSRELSDKNFFAEPVETGDWEELTRAIRNRLAADTPTKIPYFLLTLDEADKFIESCAENNYAPIVALAKTQQEDYNGSRFKFVIAGLRNIIRFERAKTFRNNSILPMLKLLPVKPFDYEDARKLLEVPLKYLGLYFPDDNKDSLILTILETTNYFPSLIQLYCEKLIKALFEAGYAGYDADSPVYQISEEHIKKILADREFTEDIKNKIEITLRLGEDKYYYVIANLLARLYYEQNRVDGYTPREILNAAENFELIKEPFLPDTEKKIGLLMDELCELNILRKTGDEKYLFSRQRILRIVGTLAEVDETLLNLMAEAGND